MIKLKAIECHKMNMLISPSYDQLLSSPYIIPAKSNTQATRIKTVINNKIDALICRKSSMLLPQKIKWKTIIISVWLTQSV